MKNLIFSFAFLFSIPAISQSEEPSNVPELGGHYFIPGSNTPAPFIKTHFGMNLGVAVSNDFENVILEIDGEKLLALQGSLIFADLTFDYQQKVKDWVAFYLSVGATARVGTELQSMLTQGVNTVVAFRTGWLVKITEGPKSMLSGNFQINNFNANLIDIGGFVDDIIEDSVATSISRKVPILNGTVGLRYAYSFSPVFGLQAFGDIGYGDTFERGKSSSIFRVGALIDANLATTTNTPLGFALFYNISSMPDYVQVESKSASNLGLKISYSSAPHFNIGLEVSQIRVPLPNLEEKVNSATFVITSKYYFN